MAGVILTGSRSVGKKKVRHGKGGRRSSSLIIVIGSAIAAVCLFFLWAASYNTPEAAEESTTAETERRTDALTTACDDRWSRKFVAQSIALRAAQVVPAGETLIVGVLTRKQKDGHRRSSQHALLAKSLRAAGGGNVIFTWAYVEKQIKNASVRSIWRHEAAVRNEILAKVPQNASAVLLADSNVQWCAVDALRLVAALESADASCGEFLEADPRSVHVSEEAPSTCEPVVRGASSAPRDIWTGDVLPRRSMSALMHTDNALIWPARVLACWSGLVALRADHLKSNQNPPPLRFRVAKRTVNECDAPPPAQFILDLHRRVQQSQYGSHAIVLSDPGGLVAYSVQSLSMAQSSDLPDSGALTASHTLLEPLEMPRAWRCCRGLSCIWRPTLLDRVHGTLTASALLRRSAKNHGRELLFFGHRRHRKRKMRRRLKRRKERDKIRHKLDFMRKPHESSMSTHQEEHMQKLFARKSKPSKSTLAPHFPMKVNQEESKIPLTIYQTFSTGEEELPLGLKNAAATWRDRNPEFEYKYFSNKEVREYIQKHFGEREMEALDSAPSGAHRADLWRYLVIGREGGVYTDIDTLCERPISSWLNNEKGVLVAALQGDPRFDMSQWTFAASPGHPVVLRAARLAVDNLLNARSGKKFLHEILAAANGIRGLRRTPSAHAPHGFDFELRFDCPMLGADSRGHDGETLTGPPVFQLALEVEAIARSGLSRQDLGPQLATALYTEKRHDLQIALRDLVSLRPPNYGGAVNPKYTDESAYRADLELAHVRHWTEKTRY